MPKLNDAERNQFSSIAINSFVEYSDAEIARLRTMAQEISEILSALSQRLKKAA